jgi:heat shock protein HtpX
MSSTTDWRANLRSNQRHTYIVIALFFVIYLGLGLLIDLLMTMGNFSTPDGQPISASVAFQALIHLQVFPYATVTAGVAAIIGLWVTYAMSDRVMLLGTQYHQVTAETTDLAERQLYNVVEEMKVAAGLNFMPKVYIIEADYMNAFASGYSEKSAMVAITRGLMNKLTRAEIQAVMAHELSHIRHRDIKLTLTASVLSNLILIVLDIIFYKFLFSGGFSGRRSQQQQMIFMVILILRYVMPIVTLLLMMYLSRTREYMADSGCVELMRDNEPLASALQKIHQDHTGHLDQQRVAYEQTPHEAMRRAAYLYDPHYAGINPSHDFSSLFSTHPPLKARLAALGVKTD